MKLAVGDAKRGLHRAGELLPALGIVPVRQSLSAPREARLDGIAAEILADPADADDAVYLHSILCQVGMPRKRVDGRRFERTNGNASLLLTAGEIWNGRQWIAQPLPYGPKPRVVLMNLTSTAVRTNNRFVDVGRSTREFMERVGLPPQGSEYRSLRQQLAALSVCRVQLGGWANGRAVNMPDNQPIRKFDVWLVPGGDQQTLWPGEVELSTEYFEGVKQHAVPLDERAVAALRGSALALDIYTWLAHRLCRVKGSKGDPIRWAALQLQFGQEYSRRDHFRAKFRIALAQVWRVYPTARLQETNEGLRLLSSPPPVASR